MSLVTAKIVGEHIYCIGDTKITYTNNENSNPILNGSLKQYIFNNLLVCFAGCVNSFERDIEKYRARYSIEEIVEIATSCTSKYELLAASYNPSRIIIIKDNVAREMGAGFIGSVDAFERYQSHYHDPKPFIEHTDFGSINIFQIPEPVPVKDEYTRMYEAMKGVTTDSDIETVGGAVIPISTHKGMFQYMMYCDVFTDEAIPPEPGETKTIGFGTKEGGGCAVEFTSCNENKGLALQPAYYFLQGGFGVVFPEAVGAVSNAHLIQAGNPCEWALATREIMGEAVISAYLSIDHCCIEAEKYFGISDYKSALECYKLRIEQAKEFTGPRPKLDRFFSGYYASLFNTGNQRKAILEMSDLVANNPDFKNCQHCFDEMQKMG